MNFTLRVCYKSGIHIIKTKRIKRISELIKLIERKLKIKENNDMEYLLDRKHVRISIKSLCVYDLPQNCRVLIFDMKKRIVYEKEDDLKNVIPSYEEKRIEIRRKREEKKRNDRKRKKEEEKIEKKKRKKEKKKEKKEERKEKKKRKEEKKEKERIEEMKKVKERIEEEKKKEIEKRKEIEKKVKESIEEEKKKEREKKNFEDNEKHNILQYKELEKLGEKEFVNTERHEKTEGFNPKIVNEIAETKKAPFNFEVGHLGMLNKFS